MPNAISTWAARFRLVLSLSLLGVMVAACGGGGVSTVPPDNQGPEGASLTGQIVEAAANRAASMASFETAGSAVTLIEAESGELSASAMTDANGRFEFSAVPAEVRLLLRAETTTGFDFDASGAPDMVTFSIPLVVSADSSAHVRAELSAFDSDGDLEFDGIDVWTRIDGSAEGSTDSRVRLNLRDKTVIIGADAEAGAEGGLEAGIELDDADGDGLPEKPDVPDAEVEAGLEGAAEATLNISGMVRSGEIEDISAEVVVIGSTSFSITSATEFMDAGGGVAVAGDFSAGMEATVRGFSNGESNIALDIQAEAVAAADMEGEANPPDEGGGDDPPDDGGGDDGGSDVMAVFEGSIEAVSQSSITVDGTSFMVDSETEFHSETGLLASLSGIGEGDIVSVEAMQSGDVWTATSVTLLAKSDDGGPGGLL